MQYFEYGNVRFILIFVLSFLLSGCSLGGKSSLSHFYVLDSRVEGGTNQALRNLRIGVGPVDVPGYIDRPQIVTKTEEAEIQLAEFERWAEPMSAMFTRTLSENITILTGSDHVYSYPWQLKNELDYKLNVNIIKFENNADGDALLIVHWQVRSENGSEVVDVKHSQYRAKATGAGYGARIVALNDTVAQFANEVVSLL